MNLTQEQRLDVCKFLAEKLGKKVQFLKPDTWNPQPRLLLAVNGVDYDPFTSPAQRWEVLDAAVESGMDLDMSPTITRAWPVSDAQPKPLTAELKLRADGGEK